MDVQGSQFHLLHGRVDWGGCTDAAFGVTLADLWESAASPSALPSAWEYDDAGRVLRLRRDTPLFKRARRSAPYDASQRRGADIDADGGWHWIDADRRGIRRRTGGAKQSMAWWSVDDIAASCTCGSGAPPGEFAGTCTCGPVDLLLAGLCVTTHDYLLAGYVSEGTPEAGLLVFDLRAGGGPLRLPRPQVPFDPWDLVATADGGALVLDRTHGQYWRLDHHLRLRGTVPQQPIDFTAADGSGTFILSGPAIPTPTDLVDADGATIHPISVEPGPGGGVLFLESDPARGYSRLFCFDGATLRWESSLEDAVRVIDPDDPDAESTTFDILGHDVVCLEAGGPLAPPLLFVADSEGDQVVAFTLDPVTGAIEERDDFLPLRRWPGRALVGARGDVWYDFDQQTGASGSVIDTRWVSLQVFAEPTFATEATLLTPTDSDSFGDVDGIDALGDVGGPFDSRTPGCVWHRLLLDAHLPTGTALTLRARASDDPATLALTDWVTQPTPYLRSGGSELAFEEPWSDWRGDVRAPTPLPAGMGTYELLVQQVRGCFLQLELTVTGTGRSTPLLRSLRAWFARFSYVEHYLPTVYAEHDATGRFLERFLANPEGLLTALEERIEHSHLLLDARTVPALDLPWLAAWFGLALDPQWDEARRRFLIRNVDRFYRMRGTPRGLIAALKVYLEPVVDESVFCGGDSATGLRIVERFVTRDTGGAEYGAPEGVADPDPRSRVRTAAHRFDVLVPVDLGEDQTAMVQRIVEQARPAHTAFGLRRYYDLFVVGQARLGIDTELGRGPSYQPSVTGRTSLAAGYLGYPFPFDLTDRVVADRDRVGALPAL